MLLHVRKISSSYTHRGYAFLDIVCAKCNSRVSPYSFEIHSHTQIDTEERLQFENFSILWGHSMSECVGGWCVRVSVCVCRLHSKWDKVIYVVVAALLEVF